MSDIKNLMKPTLSEEKLRALNEAKARVRAGSGENKQIIHGNYDKSLAVKCVNGTFVGRKTGNVIALNSVHRVLLQPQEVPLDDRLQNPGGGHGRLLREDGADA